MGAQINQDAYVESKMLKLFNFLTIVLLSVILRSCALIPFIRRVANIRSLVGTTMR